MAEIISNSTYNLLAILLSKLEGLEAYDEYMGDMDGEGRSTDARASGATTVAWIPTADLLTVLLSEPVTVTLHLFQNVLTLLRRTNALYVDEADTLATMSKEFEGQLVRPVDKIGDRDS